MKCKFTEIIHGKGWTAWGHCEKRGDPRAKLRRHCGLSLFNLEKLVHGLRLLRRRVGELSVSTPKHEVWLLTIIIRSLCGVCPNPKINLFYCTNSRRVNWPVTFHFHARWQFHFDVRSQSQRFSRLWVRYVLRLGGPLPATSPGLPKPTHNIPPHQELRTTMSKSPPSERRRRQVICQPQTA